VAITLWGRADLAIIALALPMAARVFALDYANSILAGVADRSGLAFTSIAPAGAGLGAILAMLGAEIPTAGLLASIGLISAMQVAAIVAGIKRPATS